MVMMVLTTLLLIFVKRYIEDLTQSELCSKSTDLSYDIAGLL